MTCQANLWPTLCQGAAPIAHCTAGVQEKSLAVPLLLSFFLAFSLAVFLCPHPCSPTDLYSHPCSMPSRNLPIQFVCQFSIFACQFTAHRSRSHGKSPARRLMTAVSRPFWADAKRRGELRAGCGKGATSCALPRHCPEMYAMKCMSTANAHSHTHNLALVYNYEIFVEIPQCDTATSEAFKKNSNTTENRKKGNRKKGNLRRRPLRCSTSLLAPAPAATGPFHFRTGHGHIQSADSKKINN